MTPFIPKIVGFLCNWCSYSAAHNAGSARRTHPAEVVFVRVMCTGRIDAQLVLKAFHEGADGVMILGCHPGDCHYKEGNLRALKRIKLLDKVIKQMGLDQRRLLLDWVSASESERFVEVTNKMVENIRTLGPLWAERGDRPTP